MIEKINEKVTVLSLYDRDSKNIVPVKVKWQGKVYRITKLGFHHAVRVGRVLHHVFSVTAEAMFFRLNLDTETLSWTLEEVSDGLTN